MKPCIETIAVCVVAILIAANMAVAETDKSNAVPDGDANIHLTQVKLPSGRDDFYISILAHPDGAATVLYQKYDETSDTASDAVKNPPFRLTRHWNITSNAFEIITTNMLANINQKQSTGSSDYTPASTNYAYKMSVCQNNTRNAITNTITGVSDISLENLYNDLRYCSEEDIDYIGHDYIHSAIEDIMYYFPPASTLYDKAWRMDDKEFVDYYGGTRNLAWWHKTDWLWGGANSPPPPSSLPLPARIATTNLFSRTVPETGAVLRMSEKTLTDGWSQTTVWFNETVGFGEGLALIHGISKDGGSIPMAKCQWFFERKTWDVLTNHCFDANASMYLDGFDTWPFGGSSRLVFSMTADNGKTTELEFYKDNLTSSTFERLPQIVYDVYAIIPLNEFTITPFKESPMIEPPVWNMRSAAGTLVRYFERKRDYVIDYDIYDLYLSPRFYELEREKSNGKQ